MLVALCSAAPPAALTRCLPPAARSLLVGAAAAASAPSAPPRIGAVAPSARASPAHTRRRLCSRRFDADARRGAAVLGRLQAFVPQLAAANAALASAMATRPAHEFQVEHLVPAGSDDACGHDDADDDGDGDDKECGTHVAMEIACGVVELRDAAAQAAAERAMAPGAPPFVLPSGFTDSESDGDSDSDAGEASGEQAAGDGATTTDADGDGDAQAAEAPPVAHADVSQRGARSKRPRIEVLQSHDK